MLLLDPIEERILVVALVTRGLFLPRHPQRQLKVVYSECTLASWGQLVKRKHGRMVGPMSHMGTFTKPCLFNEGLCWNSYGRDCTFFHIEFAWRIPLIPNAYLF